MNRLNLKKKDFSFLKKTEEKKNSSYSNNNTKRSSGSKIEVVPNKIHLVQDTFHEISDDKLSEEGQELLHKLKYGIQQTDNNIIINTDKDTPLDEKIFENKFEKYNVQQLSYNVLKHYSKCTPKNKNFLQRMQYYAIKKQTRNDVIKSLVENTKLKIKESEKIKTFNRLIEDSNRRAEARNRIAIVNNNPIIAKEMFDEKNNLIIPKKKKFDKKGWEQKYQKEIEKIKEREKKNEEQRQKNLKKQKMKEDQELEEMKKFNNRKASKDKINVISQRLYTAGNTNYCQPKTAVKEKKTKTHVSRFVSYDAPTGSSQKSAKNCSHTATKEKSKKKNTKINPAKKVLSL